MRWRAHDAANGAELKSQRDRTWMYAKGAPRLHPLTVLAAFTEAREPCDHEKKDAALG